MSWSYPYTIFPLGDSALTIDFGNVISRDINRYVLALFYYFKKKNIYGVVDIVPAYSSVSIYYDVGLVRSSIPGKTAFEIIKAQAEEGLKEDLEYEPAHQRKISIPVCYSGAFAPDIELIASEKKLSIDKIVELHTEPVYSVYMIGFLPGFPYMGEVNDAIAIARKTEPRRLVAAGSVAIAGKQTGIYPLDSPGGWQIIGRTPLKIFNKDHSEPVLLQPGDEIQFYSITENEFESY